MFNHLSRPVLARRIQPSLAWATQRIIPDDMLCAATWGLLGLAWRDFTDDECGRY